MEKRKARADPKGLEFSKVIMKQEMQLLWINTLGVLGWRITAYTTILMRRSRG